MSIQSASVVLLTSAVSILVAADTKPGAPTNGSEVLIEINGAKVTRTDFESTHAAALFQARNSFYQAEQKALEEFIDEYLLERQAEQEHVTVAELLDRHVKSVIAKDPSEEALRVYYEGVETTQPYEALRDQILQQIRQSRLAKAKSAYLKELRSKASITIRLAAPRAAVSLKDTPIRGLPGAPVTVVEFADYECPYCQQIQPTLDKLEAEYKGKIAFAYKDVPLPMHSHAQKAAEAAHCAGAQGKYWKYHDLLFSNKRLDLPQLKENARALQLDTQAFDRCLESSEQAETVKAQLLEGQGFRLQGTPSFFINGRFFSGVLTYEQFRVVLEEELANSRPTAAK